MKGLAKELALFGTIDNRITPSLVETDLLQEMNEVDIAGIRPKKLMGRLCIVCNVAWVGSRPCRYSTGACFDFAGDRAQF